MHVKKGDTVVVRAGAFKSNTPHEVIGIDKGNNLVTIKDVNVRLKNLKRTQESPKGGQLRKEFPIHASNVALWDDKAKSAVRTRVEGKGRAKKRVSVKTGKVFGE